MMAWVSGVVRVMWQTVCGVVMRVVRNEKGEGGSSPCCTSSLAQSMVLPSSRGGVPVLETRPIVKPNEYSVLERPMLGASPTRPAGILVSPIWMRPLRNVPVVSTTARPRGSFSGQSAVTTPNDPLVHDQKIFNGRRQDGEIVLSRQHVLHCRSIELPVRLRPRSAHSRTLAAVEGMRKLDAGRIRDAAHHAIERIDLAHGEMTLADAADGRVARHLADGPELVRQQQRPGTKARRSRSRLAAGMASTNDNDVERVHGAAH